MKWLRAWVRNRDVMIPADGSSLELNENVMQPCALTHLHHT